MVFCMKNILFMTRVVGKWLLTYSKDLEENDFKIEVNSFKLIFLRKFKKMLLAYLVARKFDFIKLKEMVLDLEI